MPTFFDAIQDATLSQVKYRAAKAALKGMPPTVDMYRLTAAKAKALCNTVVLFAATFLRRAAPKDSDRAGAAAQLVRQVYNNIGAAVTAANNATTVEAASRAASAAEQGRVRCQSALLDLMQIVDPPGPPPQLPPRLVQVEDCEAFDKAIGGISVDAGRAVTPEQQRAIAYMQDKARALLAHLLTKHPKDPHTRLLNMHWCRRVVPMSESSEVGPTMKVTGVRYSRCVAVSLDLMAGMPRSLNTLLHELAHIASGSDPHGPDFYTVNRKFLRIATQELNWTLETWCRETCDLGKDRNTTNPAAVCPKCTWQAPPDRCMAAVATQPRVCRPQPEFEVAVPQTAAPTVADVPVLRAVAAEAARRAGKALLDLSAAKVDARTASQVSSQAQRSIAANKRLESSPKATPALVATLNHIAVNGMEASETMLSAARAAPRPMLA